MRDRSTVCTQSKCAAISRVLFVCNAPMKWRRKSLPCERSEVRARLLHVVLAEVGEPGAQGAFHALDRLRFANADQGDGRRVAACRTCGDRDAIPHRGQPISGILRSG